MQFLNLIQTQTMTSMYGKVELLCEMKKFDLARKLIDKTGRGTEDHCVRTGSDQALWLFFRVLYPELFFIICG